MKKHGMLNSDISKVLSDMGHTDQIAIGDCGLPIPKETKRIDLALRFGTPTFLEVLDEMLKEMKVEKIVLAHEIKDKNPKVHEEILVRIKEMDHHCDVEYVPHEALKEGTKSCKAVIRTGETTPYANIILQSACIF